MFHSVRYDDMNSCKIHRVVAVVYLFSIVLRECIASSFADLESSDKCVSITKCEPVMRLLKVPMIKKSIWKEVKQAHCGSEGAEMKIYCDVQKIIHRPERFEPVIAAHSEDYMTTATPPPLDPLFTSTDSESSDKCVSITKCEPVMRLLKVPMIKKSIWKEVKRARCGSEGAVTKIYCDVQKIIHRPERFEPVIAAHSDDYMTTAIPPSLDPVFTSIDKHPNFRLLDHDICGPVPRNYRNHVKTRIVGGRVTAIDEFPWMALLAYQEKNYHEGKAQFRCGGSVINRNHILTAAHCVTNLRDRFKFVSVRIGEHNQRTERDCESDGRCNVKYQDFGIDKVYSHSGFSTESLQNDIAIIRLNGSIDYTRTQVRPICLPIEPEQTMPKKGIVTGWGSTDDDSPGSHVLLKVSLPILSSDKCEDAYSNTSPYMKIWHKQFCAGGVLNMDSCTGDSGGPLQIISKYKSSVRMVQRGIVSYGRRACGLEDSPGVYTSVLHYIPWILDTIRP